MMSFVQPEAITQHMYEWRGVASLPDVRRLLALGMKRSAVMALYGRTVQTLRNAERAESACEVQKREARSGQSDDGSDGDGGSLVVPAEFDVLDVTGDDPAQGGEEDAAGDGHGNDLPLKAKAELTGGIGKGAEDSDRSESEGQEIAEELHSRKDYQRELTRG